MSFQRTVPKTAGDLATYLKKIYDNIGHVKGVEVNLTTGHLEIALDFGAHIAGNSDVYLPIKRAKLAEAKDMVHKMLMRAHQGFPPSDHDAIELFDMIDPMGK